MQNLLARVGNPALRQGLIFGIFLGVILLALSFIINDLIITFALILLAAFIAGMRASQETGRLATGTLAGLWTGLIGIFIPSIISVVFVLFNIEAYRKSLQTAADKQHLNITYTNSQLFTSLAINFLFLIVLGILPGVIGGAVGGNFGRRRAPRLPPVEAYEETYVEASTPTPQDESPSATLPEEQTSSTPPAE
jgi:hypothetical protein